LHAVNDVPSRPDAVEDEDDLVACYRHADRMTALHCITCDKPICIDCAVLAAVGQKCPDCARLPRSARAVVPASAYLRAGAVALVASAAAGYLYYSVSIPLLGWIIALFVGGAIGNLASRAAGGYRHVVLARLVTALVALGFSWPVLAQLLANGSVGRGTVLELVGALFAAGGAWRQMSS
jgi:hypothetical protein